MPIATALSTTWSRSIATYKKIEPVLAKLWLGLLTGWITVSFLSFVLFPKFWTDGGLNLFLGRAWLITGVFAVFGLYFLEQILDHLNTRRLFGLALIAMIFTIVVTLLILYRAKHIYGVC